MLRVGTIKKTPLLLLHISLLRLIRVTVPISSLINQSEYNLAHALTPLTKKRKSRKAGKPESQGKPGKARESRKSGECVQRSYSINSLLMAEHLRDVLYCRWNMEYRSKNQDSREGQTGTQLSPSGPVALHSFFFFFPTTPSNLSGFGSRRWEMRF